MAKSKVIDKDHSSIFEEMQTEEKTMKENNKALIMQMLQVQQHVKQ